MASDVYVAGRVRGQLVYDAWCERSDLERRRAELAAAHGPVDAVELGYASDRRRLPSVAALADEQIGVCGLELALGNAVERWAPSRMIADNVSFAGAFRAFCEQQRVTSSEFFARAGRVASFAVATQLVPSGGDSIELHRGGRLVDAAAVTPALVEAMAREAAAWLVGNTDRDGKVPYKYLPSRDEYSPADNTIRQFMATICLGRIGATLDDDAARAAARRNLAYNLGRFFEPRDGHAVIRHDGNAKLGATALAALAILEQAGTSGAHAAELAALARGVEAMWRPSGAFKTFHYPPERTGHDNFYPGEALLFWAALWRATGDAALLARFTTSFRYYRAWHREHQNPAFVPWHTQAYASVFERTGDPELRAFSFEMNDWLLLLQQGDELDHPDLAGRFYDPDQPELGPPHASSTGVYLEGLADAFALALAAGDEPRADAYAAALCAGIRNLRQLQFKEPSELYYIAQPSRVAGALRTNGYDNTIRVDNVQHGLMALLKLVARGHHHACCARGRSGS